MRIVPVVSLLVAFLCGSATAQEYPAKPVRLVVPYAAGGGSDVIGRLFAQKLTDSLGQSVIVDNRAGASGIIGADAVAKSPADGYTLLLVDMPHTITPIFTRKLPYDPVKDFTAVSMVGKTPIFLFTNPSLAVSTVAEFLDLARKEGGRLTLGLAGTGTSGQMLSELLRLNTGVQFTLVPYKGAGPALNDLVGGQIRAMFASMASGAPHVKAGRLKVIASTGARRSPEMPDTPTFAEVNVRGLEVEHWYGIVGPAGLPKAVVDKLAAAIGKASGMPDVRERMTGVAVDPAASTPDQFRARIEADFARWSKLARDANLQPGD